MYAIFVENLLGIQVEFISVRLTQKGLCPTGYRTCQFYLTPSVYIILHTSSLKIKFKYNIATVESA